MLPVRPPVAPMLAKLARELPTGADWSYEPKWDGFRCLAFRDGDGVELLSRHDLVTTLEGHPWEHGFALEGGPMGRLKGAAGRWRPGMTLDWVPLRPTLVVEVGYDQLDGLRFRHPARLLRWRPDRDARSCTVDQLLDAGATPA